ncbi:hypothetical protein AAVH_10906 [Aphelenchoides avenae]|nr:hypothetical protein AAVH_10906 [Aphelenchus avenae]
MAAAVEHHHHQERQYQICSITKSPVYVSRPLPERCHLPPGIKTVKARVQIYRPRLSQIAIHAYSCTNVTYVTCGTYFFGIRTGAHNAEPTYKVISSDGCWKFAEDANLTAKATTNRAVHDISTTGRMPLPPVQSAFVLKPHTEVPKAVQDCIGGIVLAAGNDAFIKFLDTLPANITSPWMTHNMTPSQRSRRSTEAQLRTGFGGTERRPRDLHFPSTTDTETLTPTQQLEAVKLKFQTLRAVLSLPPAQAFYNTNVNCLAYDVKRSRLERQRKQTKRRDAEKAKTVSRSPTSRTGAFEEQQACLRAVNNHNVKPSDVLTKTALQHKQTFITKAATTTQTYAPTETSVTTKATSITQQQLTTTAPTISATTPETPQFPYTEPKIFLAKKETNGSIYFHGTTRKKYWDLKLMPHGSAVLEKETDVVHHVFWPSTDAEGIRLYRLSRFEHEEE